MTDLEDLFDGALTIETSHLNNIENIDSSSGLNGKTAMYNPDQDEEMYETNSILQVRTINPTKKLL